MGNSPANEAAATRSPCHHRLIHREQAAARLRVITAGLLLVGGDGADPLLRWPAKYRCILLPAAHNGEQKENKHCCSTQAAYYIVMP